MLVRLLLLFTVVPVLELMLLLELGRVVGLAPTLAIVLLTGVVGAWLARWQGLATLRTVQTEMAGGRVPAGALVDGLLILVAGALLLTPGLLTDTVGFLLLVPPTRAAVRTALTRAITAKLRPAGPVTLDTEWVRDQPPPDVG